MALSQQFTVTRPDIGDALSTPNTRGLVYNGQQVEMVFIKKLTGDTTGSITLGGVQRPAQVFVVPTFDNAGAEITADGVASVTFTHTDNVTIALSGLGTWTRAVLYVCGRSFDYLS
jgi:hypothetical protein